MLLLFLRRAVTQLPRCYRLSNSSGSNIHCVQPILPLMKKRYRKCIIFRWSTTNQDLHTWPELGKRSWLCGFCKGFFFHSILQTLLVRSKDLTLPNDRAGEIRCCMPELAFNHFFFFFLGWVQSAGSILVSIFRVQAPTTGYVLCTYIHEFDFKHFEAGSACPPTLNTRGEIRVSTYSWLVCILHSNFSPQMPRLSCNAFLQSVLSWAAGRRKSIVISIIVAGWKYFHGLLGSIVVSPMSMIWKVRYITFSGVTKKLFWDCSERSKQRMEKEYLCTYLLRFKLCFVPS